MSGRRTFTKTDENLLAQYIAKYNPQIAGRSGNLLYQNLVANEEGKWPWAKNHSWQSWRNYYTKDRARMDKIIARYVKPSNNPDPATPRKSVQAAPSHPQTIPSSQAKRAPFTREEDQNIIDFLAHAPPTLGSRKGQKLWKALEDNPAEYPWAQRRGWQSWRERYVKHAAYFDQAVQKQLRGDEDDEPAIPPPKTAEDYRVHRRPAQAASSAHAQNASPEKRKRVSNAAQQAPPKKRQRVEEEQPEAGPSRHRYALPDEDAEQAAEDDHDGELPEAEDEAQGADDPDEQSDDDEDDEEGEDDEDDDDDDERPIGSDEYRGEIFESSSQAEDAADAPEDQALSDSSAEDQQEAFHMLTDDPRPDAQDVEMDVDETPEQTAVDVPETRQNTTRSSPPERKHQQRILRDLDPVPGTPPLSPTDEAQARHRLEHDHSPAPPRKHVPRIHRPGDDDMNVDDAGEQTAVDVPDAKQNTTRSSPPERKHQQRIVRDLDPAPGTPPLSPTDEAQARHHLEHDHSPAPARKHVPRIRRPADEDFFGTPQSKATSTSGTAVSSPTEERIHARRDRPVEDEDDEVKPRAPLRLDEGAWTKAFSDIRGKARVSGTSRRRSGVDFEDEDQVIGVQDTPGSADRHGGGDDGEAVDTTPTRWPPRRRKDRAAEAPSTPVAGRSAKDKGKARADASVDSVVRTEKVVSVKTVRTVERRIPRASNGTPYVRAALAAAAEDEDSQDEEDAEPEPSQHHPFSQPVFAPKMAASTSGSSHSVASNLPVPKAEVSRLQRLLSANLREMVHAASPSKAERASRPPASAQSAAGVGKGHRIFARPATPSRVRAAPSRETISPPDAVRDDDGERFEQFEERDEELPRPFPAASPSPLAGKGEPRPAVRRILGDLIPQASHSHSRTMSAYAAVRADKGKAKAGETSHASRHARRHTLAGPDARDAFSGASHDVEHRPRRSVPPVFTIGDELPRSALSLLFNQPRSGSAHPRTYSLAHPPGSGSSRSISPHMSADVAAAKRLPANELDVVLEIGIGQVFRIMAENHGFGESTVRDAFAATGSLEQTDRLLCRMRESANKTANEVLQSLDGDDRDDEDEGGADADENGDDDGGYPEDDEPEAADEDEDQFDDEGDSHGSRRLAGDEEEEVEHALEEDSWMQDDAPLAESSRFVDASHSHRGSSFGSDARRRQSLLIKRVPFEPLSPAEYSPPKRTRAAKHVRQSLSRAPDAMDVDSANATTSVRTPEIGHVRPSGVGLGQLAKYDNDRWRRLGRDEAKVATGKALANLLK